MAAPNISCGDANDDAAGHRAGLFLHDRAVAGDDQDADQQERREQTVEDRRPVERFDRANLEEVERDADGHRGDEHGVEAAGAREFLSPVLAAMRRFRRRHTRRIRRASGWRESQSFYAGREKNYGEISGQRPQRFRGLARGLDFRRAAFVERERGRENDEIHHEIRGEVAACDIELAIRDFLVVAPRRSTTFLRPLDFFSSTSCELCQ